MTFLVDSNACIEYIRGKNIDVLRHFSTTPFHEIVVCPFVSSELEYGAKRSRHPIQELQKVTGFLSNFVSLHYSERAASIYVDRRLFLESRGLMIGSFDLMIASIAMENDLTLVTHNTAEFARVPGLKLVDWQIP